MINFVYVAKGQEHVDMACQSAESARVTHPNSEIVIYVDKMGYDFSAMFDDIIVEETIFAHRWMLTNVMAQTDWLLRDGNCGDINVFLDNDIIVRQTMPLGTLPDADMYVTWRDDVGDLSTVQPYNYGVLIVRSHVNAIRAMMWLENRVAQLAPKHQKWYGNQMALRELVGPLNRNETVTRNFQTFSIDVHQLPCHKWNWSPPTDKLKQSASDKLCVHLKGDRKEAMPYYHDLVVNQ